MKKAMAVAALILGVLLVGLAIVYWTTPASSLPSYVPGYDPTMAGVHFKHGLASLIAAILLFVYAWFATGKKSRG